MANSPKVTSVYDLLTTAPDEQVTRLKLAWRDTAAGKWQDAAHWLRNAAREGNTTWHDECAVMAVELEAKQSREH